MRRITVILTVLLIALLQPVRLFAAGSVTQTASQSGAFLVVTLSWTGDVAGGTVGTVPSTATSTDITAAIAGYYLAMVVTNPGTTVPTNAYDIVLNDADGVDVMAGALVDRSSTASEQAFPPVTSRPVTGALTLVITNNIVASATGTVVLYFSHAPGPGQPTSLTLAPGGALRTGMIAGNTALLQAYDTDTGPAYTTFGTLTAGTTPSFTIGSSTIGILNGAVATPSLLFSTDSDTGLYLKGANILGIAGSAYISGDLEVAGSSTIDVNETILGNLAFATGGAIRTGLTAGNTFLLQGYNTSGTPAYNTVATITAANGTPTIAIPTITGATTFSAGVTFTTLLSSVTALATPSALSATAVNAFASTVSGATLMGYGTTADVTLKNRAGADVLKLDPNATGVTLVGALAIGGALSGATSVTVTNGGALRTGTTASDSLLLQAYDNNTGPGYITFATLTAGNDPTMDLATGVTIGSAYIYRAAGTDIPVTDGGTGVSTLTTAYGLLAAGTTATGTVQTLPAGLTTQILVGGGASALPAWGADIPTAVTIGSAYIYRAAGTDIPVTDGGTGVSTLTTAYGLLAAGTTATGTVQTLPAGLTTQILVGGGASALPAWGADIPTAVTIGSAYIYRASGTDVAVADGGTGASTFALNGVLYGNTTSAIGATAIGAEGQILRVGASPFVPAWTTATYPATTTANQVLFSSAANVVGGDADLTYNPATDTLAATYFAGDLAGPELITAPMVTGGWTLGYDTGGWEINAGVLTKTASTATLTATSTTGMTAAPTIGVTYRVTIVSSAASGSTGWALGGVVGTPITTATTTIQDITATSNAKILFQSANTVTVTITSVSVRQIVPRASIYLAGGIDIPVTDGGTGVSTLTTAYGLLAAGTTATGNVQTLPAGLTTQILVGGGASALPAWGADLPTAVTIGSAYIYRVSGTDVAVADGGTGVGTFTTNGILYGNAATSVLVTAASTAAGKMLTTGETPFVPVWSTSTYADTYTQGSLLYAGTANVITGLGATSTAGKFIRAGAAATYLPEWSTLVLPNAATQGDLMVATSANTVGSVIAAAVGQVLISAGTGTVPAWSTDLATAVTIGTAYIYRAGGTDIPVADGGTNCSSASITCFNNITGYTASGATGTTSTNVVFSASPTFTGTVAADVVSATGMISGLTQATNYTTGQTLAGVDVKKAVITNSGAAALIHVLPNATVGLTVTFYVVTAAEIKFRPDTGDIINYASATTSQGLKNTTPFPRGDYISLICLVADNWEVVGVNGTWTAYTP